MSTFCFTAILHTANCVVYTDYVICIYNNILYCWMIHRNILHL